MYGYSIFGEIGARASRFVQPQLPQRLNVYPAETKAPVGSWLEVQTEKIWRARACLVDRLGGGHDGDRFETMPQGLPSTA